MVLTFMPWTMTPALRYARMSFRMRLSPTFLATLAINASWLTRSKNESRSMSTTQVRPSSMKPLAVVTAMWALRFERNPKLISEKRASNTGVST